MNQNNRATFSFAALDPYVESNIISPKETLNPSKGMVEWGERNYYPEYLLDLYRNVPTLRTIINGNVDYIAGNDITIAPLHQGALPGVMNKRGDIIRDQVRDIARDYEMYGGYALQVIRNLAGEVAEIYYIDMRYLRTNKEGNVFYYSEKWSKTGTKKVIEYPAFLPSLNWATLTDAERARHASSIVFIKNEHTQVYPAPLYAASVKACEIERLIDDFHLSDLNNHFVSSAIINFNNGEPEDEIKEQTEEDINEKFSGAQNGGRIMLSWNKDRTTATTIQEFKIEDFGERYKALSEHSRRQIFTSFRAIPMLFGITNEANTGFSTEEYEQSFKLYNRTQIRPIQTLIADTYDRIYGAKGVMSIKPFTLEGETESNVN